MNKKLKNKENEIIFLNCINSCIENTIKEILESEIIEIEKFSIDYSLKNLSNKFLSKLYDIESKEKEKEKEININSDFLHYKNHLLSNINKIEFLNIKKDSLELSIQYLENSLVIENKEKIINNLVKRLLNKYLFDKRNKENIINYNNYSFKNHYKKIKTNNINNLNIKDFLNVNTLFNRYLDLEKKKERKLNFLSLKERLLKKEIKKEIKSNNKISLILLNKDLKKISKRINNINNINTYKKCILILERYYKINKENEKIRKKLVKIVKDFYLLIGKNKSNDFSFSFKPIEKELNSFNLINYTKSKRNNKIIKTKKEIFKRNNNLIKELKKDFNNFYHYLKDNESIIKIESLNKDKSLKDLFIENDFILKVDKLIFDNSKWYFNNHLEYVIKYNSFNTEIYIFDKNYRFNKVLNNLKAYNKNLIDKKENQLSFYKKESDKITKHYKKGYSDNYEKLLNLSYNDLKEKYYFYLDKEYNENKNQFLIDLKLNQIEKILYDKKLEIDEIEKDKQIRNKLEIEYNEKINKELNTFKGYSINKNSYVNYEFLEIGYTENNELKIFNEPNEDSLGDRDYY